MDLCQLPGLMTQASQLAKLEPVQPRTRAASVAAVDSAGIKILKVLYTVNIKMWRHPKYYKELRKRNKEEARAQLKVPSSNLDQAISHANSTRGPSDVRPDPSPKLQASSAKLTKQQAASVKPRGTSVKLQAASDKLQDS